MAAICNFNFNYTCFHSYSNPNAAAHIKYNHQKHEKPRSNSQFYKLEAAQSLLDLNAVECSDSFNSAIVENNCPQYEESENNLNSYKLPKSNNYKFSVEKTPVDCRGSVPRAIEDNIDRHCSFFKKKKHNSQILYDLKKTGIAKNFAPQTCGPRFKRNAEKEGIESNCERELLENAVTSKRKTENAFEKGIIVREIEENFTDSESEEELMKHDFKTAREELKEQLKQFGTNNFVPQTSGTRLKRKFEEEECESERESIENDFKTAREELKEQNIKRRGAAGQKRQLGMRRGAQRKFVSPVLSSSDM